MQMFLRFPDFKSKALTLSYDDGVIYDRKMVEILNKYGIKSTFNICSGLLGKGERYISEQEVSELYKGHEVAVHTLTHPLLTNLSTAEAANEILEDRKNIEAITGKIVNGMAYPFGLSNTENEVQIAKMCGIKYARTTLNTHNFELPKDFLRWNATCQHNDGAIKNLISRFLEPVEDSNSWRAKAKLFYIWGHSYEFNDQNNWELLEEICQSLAGKNDIWYATNGEIQKYVEAFGRIEKSCDGSLIYNPTVTDIYALINCKNILIKAGETVKL